MKDAARIYQAAGHPRKRRCLLYQQTFEIMRKVYGEDNSRTLEMVGTLTGALSITRSNSRVRPRGSRRSTGHRRISGGMSTNPGQPDALLRIAKLYQSLGRHDEAIACYRKAIELDPKTPWPTQPRRRPGRTREAGRGDRLLPQGHRTRPETAVAHNNLGVALGIRGSSTRRSLLTVRPSNSTRNTAAHMNLGNALREQGKLDEAIASSGRPSNSTRRTPGLTTTWLGSSQRRTTSSSGTPRKRLSWPGRPFNSTRSLGNWNTLSVAAYGAGDWKTSLDARKAKLQRRPIAAEDRLFLAMTHWQLGNKAEARKWYDEATTEIAKDKASGHQVKRTPQGGGAIAGDTPSPTPPNDEKRS